MAECKGCFHYKVCDGDVGFGYAECPHYIPSADVVPKSEVERLEEELAKANADVKNYMKVAEYQQGLSVKRYHEIKRLNEDIERLQKALDAYEETSGLKQAKAEVAMAIFEEIEEGIKAAVSALTFASTFHRGVKHEAYLSVMRFIKTVEKKYTEGET